MTDRPGLDMSFSGLKTFAITTWRQLGSDAAADIAWAFQDAVVDTLLIKTRRALQQTGIKQLVVAGGVGANQCLRARFREAFTAEGIAVSYPRMAFCTDNGAMIALAGCLRLQGGNKAPLAIDIKPRWPLEEMQALGLIQAFFFCPIRGSVPFIRLAILLRWRQNSIAAITISAATNSMGALSSHK